MAPTGVALPAGELLWSPDEDYLARTRLGLFARWLAAERDLRFAGYRDLWRWSVEDLEGFWESIWSYFEVGEERAYDAVLADERMPGAVWFPGARLNYAELALRGGADDEVAIVARSQTRSGRSYTRAELIEEVGRVQAGLRRLGVGRGDRVAGYLPNIPEAIFAFLACAGLGAVWSACPPEFGVAASLNRLGQFAPTVLLAVDGYRWGEKEVDRRAEVTEIVAALPDLRASVLVPYLHPDAEPPVGMWRWDELCAEAGAPRFEPVPFDHPLWVLFSSGTTGPPKGFVQGHGGIVLEQLKSLALHHDLSAGDRMFFFSTTGWMVWNQLVSGLLVGAGIVILDGDPTFPRADSLWDLAAETGLTHFGASASFYMLCRDGGMAPGRDRDLGRIRFVKSAGSPLPAEGYRWLHENFPSAFLSSSSGGTEICSGFVGGITTLPVNAGEMAGRWLGVDAEAWDADGNAVIDEPGELVIRRPMPSMPLELVDPDGSRYRDEYFSMFPGVWRHGDWFVVSERGTCAILGRSDATLNRGGVRLGTGEFYAVLGELPEIADSLVVHLGGGDGGLGELILLVDLEPDVVADDELSRRIAGALRSRLSPRHVPDQLIAVPEIPRGATGKRLEVPVKRILLGVDPAQAFGPAEVDPETVASLTRMAAVRAAQKEEA